ncbi:MAG: fumarate hydratase [Clostridia bacterium]|nr:fumarate hydratase [Clostridia bacterium]
MREIDLSILTGKIRDACITANRKLPADLEKVIRSCVSCENSELSKSVMQSLADNIDAAEELGLPICQDTGMAVIFAEIGQDVHFTGGNFEDAVNEGVRRGYVEGLLRCSVVSDPLRRVNTGDNTPAVIHTRIVPGDRVKITVAPKGFGSENMSRQKMFTPSATKEEITDFIVDSVRVAGSNPCPPVIVGVGIGGDFELCALLSKLAICRNVSVHNPDPFYADLEEEILGRINDLGIGPQGFGGKTTALAVAIETYPTHIAGLPVSVNMGCHVTRHCTFTV